MLAEPTAFAAGSPTGREAVLSAMQTAAFEVDLECRHGKRERFIRPESEWQSLAERLGKAEAERDALKLARECGLARLPDQADMSASRHRESHTAWRNA